MTDRSDPSPPSPPQPPRRTPDAGAKAPTAALRSGSTPPPIAITDADIAALRAGGAARPSGDLPVRPDQSKPATPATKPATGSVPRASESQKIRVQTLERILPPKVTHTTHPRPASNDEIPDKTLVLQSMDGDNLAFEELYHRYLSRAVVAAYAVLGQREKAQDVAQEAFIEAANKLGTLREPENFGGWVCGISRRMAIVAIRKESRRLNAIRDHQEELREKPRHDEPDMAAVKDEQKQLVRRAMEKVPPKYREILLAKYVEKLSYEEIAVMCGISRAAVDKRLTRGKKIFREIMEEMTGTEGGQP